MLRCARINLTLNGSGHDADTSRVALLAECNDDLSTPDCSSVCNRSELPVVGIVRIIPEMARREPGRSLCPATSSVDFLRCYSRKKYTAPYTAPTNPATIGRWAIA